MALFDDIQQTLAAVRARFEGRNPDVGIILGSGLSAFADVLQGAGHVPYRELPHFPQSSVLGHPGRLVMGKLGDIEVVAMQGRVHLYEGYSAAQAAFPARVLCALGIRCLVVTNAAGGIQQGARPGDLMAITDHLNFSGRNPLWGPNDDRLGTRFPDVSAAYSPKLLSLLSTAAQKVGVALRSGVYAMYPGPSYETPAEIRALRVLGADAVGMSTVPEVLAAVHMGVPVAGISCITNLAAGLSDKPLSHQEVAETAKLSQDAFCRLLREFLPMAAHIG